MIFILRVILEVLQILLHYPYKLVWHYAQKNNLNIYLLVIEVAPIKFIVT